jgi:DNA-binding response OmpR family regulator
VAVLLDILLKGEDSWRWLADLKQDEQRNVPVIIASSVEDERKGLALGADAYFQKPLLKADLLSSLRELLNVGRENSLEALASAKHSTSDATTIPSDNP